MKDLKLNIIYNYLNDEFLKNESDVIECQLKEEKNQLIFKELVVVNHLVNISDNKYNAAAAYKNFEKKIVTPKINSLKLKRKTYISFLKYAAIFVITFFISHSILNEAKSQDFSEVIVPAGERSIVVLPDGTKVWLNANSILKYDSDFSKKTRNVYLKGEAFFDVVKNPKKPFVVSIEPSQIKVKVLGTTFNIKGYPEDTHITTTLLTGKIDLSHRENQNNILLPGYRADFQKQTQKIIFEKVENTNDVVAWKEKRLVFKKETLSNIINELNRFYDVKIEIATENLENKIYTASFKKDIELDQILEFLSLSGNFKCVKLSTKKWKLI